jgi:hypothetical protein
MAVAVLHRHGAAPSVGRPVGDVQQELAEPAMMAIFVLLTINGSDRCHGEGGGAELGDMKGCCWVISCR